MSKYELTDETREIDGHILHRIRAVRDIGAYVKKGDLGGWVESEDNLSQDENCWVSDEACVYGNAQVYGHAEVYGRTDVCDNAMVYDNAKVYGNARVDGCARVHGDAWVHDYATVRGDAVVWGGVVRGQALIRGDASIGSDADYTVLRNSWSSGRWITYTRSNRMWNVGCFYGSGDELVLKAYKDGDVKGKCYEIIVRAVEQIGDIAGDPRSANVGHE